MVTADFFILKLTTLKPSSFPLYTKARYFRRALVRIRLPAVKSNSFSLCKEKSFYQASQAKKEYELVRLESRSGINSNENTIRYLDNIINPLILRGFPKDY